MAATVPAGAQQIKKPTLIWLQTSDDDTPLTLPNGLVVDHRTGTVIVADLRLPGLVELDASDGHVIRVIGRKGEGPGEFLMPLRLALSPDGTLLAVYDVGRRSVEILTREGKQVRRISVGTIPFLKGMAVGNDTTVVLSGGRLAAGKMPVAITCLQSGAISSTGPVPPSVPGLPEDRDLDGRIYAAGGPLLLRGGSAVLADAGSGDIWLTTPLEAHLVATGPGAPPGLVASIIQPTVVDGQHVNRIFFGFPQAVLVETVDADRFLVGYSNKAEKTLTFYHNSKGAPTTELERWEFAPSILVRFDRETFLALERNDDGWRLSKVRMPIP